MIAPESAARRGVGLRPHHYPDLSPRPEDLWLEVLADNFLFQAGGPGLHHISRLADGGRMLMHSVGLSIAGTAPLDDAYVGELKKLAARLRPVVISDHLCFSHGPGGSSFDLLPIPYTEERLAHVASRVRRVQDTLGTRLALENVSSYVRFAESALSEMEFLAELCRRTGCGVLLDVNNAFVSAANLGDPDDAWREIARLAPGDVLQYHVAGHREEDGYRLDTHDQAVTLPLRTLLAKARARFGDHPVILERDDDRPFAETLVELHAVL